MTAKGNAMAGVGSLSDVQTPCSSTRAGSQAPVALSSAQRKRTSLVPSRRVLGLHTRSHQSQGAALKLHPCPVLLRHHPDPPRRRAHSLTAHLTYR